MSVIPLLLPLKVPAASVTVLILTPLGAPSVIRIAYFFRLESHLNFCASWNARSCLVPSAVEPNVIVKSSSTFTVLWFTCQFCLILVISFIGNNICILFPPCEGDILSTIIYVFLWQKIWLFSTLETTFQRVCSVRYCSG